MAGSLGGRGHLRDREPGRSACRRCRPRRPAEALFVGHVPLPVGVWVACRASARLHRHRRVWPLPPDGRVECACTLLASTRSACRLSSTRCSRGSIPGPPPSPISPTTVASSAGWVWPMTHAAASPPPTRRTIAGPSGSSPRSSRPGTTSTRAEPGRSPSWSRSWRADIGRPPTAARGRTCRRRSSTPSSMAIGSRTWPTARSTGVQGSARCWPMRR